MTLTKQGNFTFNHVDQQDDIYKVKSATDIKQAYDSRANELKVTFNNLIDALKSSTAGDSGAKSIGVETISGLSGNDVQALLQALKNQIDSTVLGNVPDGSITDQKLSVSSSSPVRFGVATGTANTYTVTLTPAPTGYFDGMAVSVKINADATAASTLNVNGLGAKPLKKANGNDATNLKTNGVYTFRYNATTQNFILQGEGGSGTATAGDILEGKTASTDTGDITGTMVDRGAMTITAGSTSQIIPAGKHNGSGTVPAVVVDPTKVLAGTTIAGTAGTMPNNTNIWTPASYFGGFDSTNGVLLMPSPGYYNNGYIMYKDSNHIPGNIKSGINVLGVNGTLSENLVTPSAAIITTMTSANTTSTIYVKVGQRFTAKLKGTFRISWQLSSNNVSISGNSTLYKNGVAYSSEYSATSQITITLDVPMNVGDYIDFYARINGGNTVFVNNVTISGDVYAVS